MDTPPLSPPLRSHLIGLGRLENDFRTDNLFRLLLPLVKGPNVIEIGCGAGHFLERLRQNGVQAVGLEPDEALVRHAQRLYPGLRIRVGDRCPPEDRSAFSTAVTIDVLEHIEDPRPLLRSLNDALAPDGLLLVVVPAHPWLYGRKDRMHGHFRRYSRRRLASEVRETGFKIISMRSWNLLGVLPYLISQKILNHDGRVPFRNAGEKNALSRSIIRLLSFYYRMVEKRLNVGVGLSLICVAKKIHP